MVGRTEKRDYYRSTLAKVPWRNSDRWQERRIGRKIKWCKGKKVRQQERRKGTARRWTKSAREECARGRV